MKVALCVQVKLENNYIREWIKYHKDLGFTKYECSLFYSARLTGWKRHH